MCTPCCEAERFLAETQQIASKVAHEIWEKPELAMIQKVSWQKKIEEQCWGFEKRLCVLFVFATCVFFLFRLPLVLEAGGEPYIIMAGPHGWKPLLCSNCFFRRPELRSLHISMRFARMMASHSMRTAPGRDGKFTVNPVISPNDLEFETSTSMSCATILVKWLILSESVVNVHVFVRG